MDGGSRAVNSVPVSVAWRLEDPWGQIIYLGIPCSKTLFLCYSEC